MERTTKENAKYMIKYKPKAYFEYRLYKKGWFGLWRQIGKSWWKDQIERKMLEDAANMKPEYYK